MKIDFILLCENVIDVADYEIELNKKIDNLPKEEKIKIIENDIKNLQKILDCLKNKEYFSMKCF